MLTHAMPSQGYTDDKQCRANAASNTLNKWMQANFREDIVVHGFRHALRDRLRIVQWPSEMIDQIEVAGHQERSGKAMVKAIPWVA